ncbi:hypothetical protein BABINDRAFT_6195 [Babjeviella inositovora NRRL Y-12698]|uniref:Protein-lysine N-methyltransferase EFM6 n=1 Tax=Babjeviella inositovora NRRL Y-12698 TaxID=984486 RepID=A0A1E3QUZ0_9ASCO|nr:uncharacterized protein BABINDRAFT_6195 [Babjeviella inositovora NRRL Y-12698]ODQ81506.1 hypothetical protein BABINDRAFT_6195 [Babjeviella inositovora NRRL Y-12698]
MSVSQDLFPLQEINSKYAAGDSVMSFGNHPKLAHCPGGGLALHQDGGAVGCGGKIWIAGECLSSYLLNNYDKLFDGKTGEYSTGEEFNTAHIVELGSGTGLVGLVLGLVNAKYNPGMKVFITDIDDLVPLMLQNVMLNHLENEVIPAALLWGEPLGGLVEDNQLVDANTLDALTQLARQPPMYIKHLKLVLAADVVYLEQAFPLLESTLLQLTDMNEDLEILMCYRKRRKQDKKFFARIAKNFNRIDLMNFNEEEEAYYRKCRVHLFKLVRKPKK